MSYIIVVWLVLVTGIWLAGPQDLLAEELSVSPRLDSAESRFLEMRRDEPVEFWANTVWQKIFQDKDVWGYANKHSVVSGESFSLILSTRFPKARVAGYVEVFRIGFYEAADRKLYWTSPSVEVRAQASSQPAAAIGPNWQPMLHDIRTQGWPSGYYIIDFVRSDNGHRDLSVASIIVTNPSRSGDMLFKLSTNTYQAYNTWGGHSLYSSAAFGDKGHMVSFDRPTPPAFFEYDYYLVLWLEKLAARDHLQIDYTSDFDVHRDGTLVSDYALLVSGAHDEYWSKEEFDHFYKRIFELGKNTIFFGGNASYFQIRYIDVNRPPHSSSWGRQMICYKSLEDPIRYRVGEGEAQELVTARFRDGARKPENMLMGVAYQGFFHFESEDIPRYPYVVKDISFPFFQDTGFRVGDTIEGIVGYEWDNKDPAGDGQELWDATTSRIPHIDTQIEKRSVLFEGNPLDYKSQEGKAEAVYFQSKAGGKVFSAGSVRWVWGLGKEGVENEKFKSFNGNLIKYFLEGQTN